MRETRSGASRSAPGDAPEHDGVAVVRVVLAGSRAPERPLVFRRRAATDRRTGAPRDVWVSDPDVLVAHGEGRTYYRRSVLLAVDPRHRLEDGRLVLRPRDLPMFRHAPARPLAWRDAPPPGYRAADPRHDDRGPSEEVLPGEALHPGATRSASERAWRVLRAAHGDPGSLGERLSWGETRVGRVPVVRVPRHVLGDGFGICWRFETAAGPDWVILLRDDLPRRMAATVLRHEIGHLGQHPGDGHWIRRELEATAPALRHDPLGVVATGLASLAPARLRFYLARLRAGGEAPDVRRGARGRGRRDR